MMRKFLIVFAILLVVAVRADSAVVTLVSPGGDNTVDGGLSVTLDPYGAFGSSAGPAGNAYFNPPGAIGSAGTTYESALFVRSPSYANFLADGGIGSSGYLPSIAFDSTGTSEAGSSFAQGGLDFVLTQMVLDTFTGGVKTGSSLEQAYSITNPGGSSVTLELTRYVDGDLYFAGGFLNDFGGESGLTLYEFDAGDDPSLPTTYLGISTPDGVAAWEVDSFSGLRSRIISGTPLDDSVAGDLNGDGITDSGYDVTLALQTDLTIGAGGTVSFTSVTDWGYGSIEEVTTVPEPGTLFLLGTGLAGLAGYGLRRRKK